MKIITALVVYFVGSLALAAVPNKFDCVDVNNSKYTLFYTPSNFFGKAEMSISVNDKVVVPKFSNGDFVTKIDSTETPLGLMVSSIVRHLANPDIPSSIFSLMVPTIDLANESVVQFRTKLFIGTSNSPLRSRGPKIKEKILEVKDLSCEAESVAF